MAKQIEKEIGHLYKTYANDLFSYALNLGFDRDISMDAIHDVFYKICLDEKVLNKIDHIRFYLLRALKNRLLDIYKQKKETVGLPSESTIDDIPFTIHVTIEDLMIKAEEQEMIRSKVEQLLESLTDRQREIIYLRYSQECDYEEIAQIMQITVPACRKLFHKALAKLKKNPYSAFLLFLLIN
ncbi:sigma-70 family RNA polymerase sigma factor [uncultured Parabacteroides sp.]|uniref:RNA polymerase sigma factor n=1 Tax=uncultured Parabacteroides sp. TaxID=512312 RepID=UPI0025989D6D|nr:sigma-70 family RNA polymerase sigma factor [uncultured Parabacteroides sp.]